MTDTPNTHNYHISNVTNKSTSTLTNVRVDDKSRIGPQKKEFICSNHLSSNVISKSTYVETVSALDALINCSSRERPLQEKHESVYCRNAKSANILHEDNGGLAINNSTYDNQRISTRSARTQNKPVLIGSDFTHNNEARQKPSSAPPHTLVNNIDANETSSRGNFRWSIYRFFSSKLVCMGPREGKDPISQQAKLLANNVAQPPSINPLVVEQIAEGSTEAGWVYGTSSNEDNRIADGSPVVSGYLTPLSDVVMFTLTNFEQRRKRFNQLQSGSISEKNWDRRRELCNLAELLLDVSRTCLKEDPNMDCNLVYEKNGLSVWKKEFGIGRILVRASFIVAVSPYEYSSYASNPVYRFQWDSNVHELKRIEDINRNIDINYIAVKRVGTIFPRDTVNLRVHTVNVYDNDRKTDARNSYTSCSCSVHHPDVPPQEGRVRMDLRIGSYVAEPYPTPFGLWTRVSSFNEGDPKGWIPATVVKMLAAKVVPSSVEKLVASIMKHHNIPISVGNATGYASRTLSGVHPSVLEDLRTTFFSTKPADLPQCPPPTAASYP